MTRKERERLRVAAEVGRVRRAMAELGFSQTDIEEEVDRVRHLRLKAPRPRARYVSPARIIPNRGVES